MKHVWNYLHTTEDTTRSQVDRKSEPEHPEKLSYYFILGRGYDQDLNLVFDKQMRNIDTSSIQIETLRGAASSGETDCATISSYTLPRSIVQSERMDEHSTTSSNTQDEIEEASTTTHQVRKLFP